MKFTFQTIPSGIGSTIPSALTPSVLAFNSPSVKTVIDNDNGGEDDDDDLVPTNIQCEVSCIVSNNVAQVIQNEAIAHYFQFTKSSIEIEFGKQLQTRDFNAIIHYLHIKKGWSSERVVGALTGYLIYLFLISVYHPQYRIIPSIDVDELWHIHIFLNTANYTHDCHELFGYYLHHQVDLSLKDTEEYDSEAAFTQTLILQEKHFGSESLAKMASTNSQKAAQSGPITGMFKYSSCSPIVFGN
ncbi:hypothetical protein BMF77_03268 [Dolichospermum sp. UHCC 0315A]|uniref:hypothetical protein n=1 Tax=Dolichospermum sp. UHCC 0315A TaxID=1914871 RepID=UPI0011E78ECF|nr:hypothetical protein [Dolichospermum sp. UHCC 0315A]QEI42657.1 hypothetical protein BMF77_03268 [Dolichospermum sp. UHCC 0315A]